MSTVRWNTMRHNCWMFFMETSRVCGVLGQNMVLFWPKKKNYIISQGQETKSAKSESHQAFSWIGTEYFPPQWVGEVWHFLWGLSTVLYTSRLYKLNVYGHAVVLSLVCQEPDLVPPGPRAWGFHVCSGQFISGCFLSQAGNKFVKQTSVYIQAGIINLGYFWSGHSVRSVRISLTFVMPYSKQTSSHKIK